MKSITSSTTTSAQTPGVELQTAVKAGAGWSNHSEGVVDPDPDPVPTTVEPADQDGLVIEY
jgi:hypothetical protein